MWIVSGKTYNDLVNNINSFVTVGDTGNPAHSGTSLGSVNYTYQISKYEITNSEYCLFLNSVDPFGSNPNSIYGYMSSTLGGIVVDYNRVAGNRYYIKENMDNKPVNFISLSMVYRFCNWLHNGAQKYRASRGTVSAPQNTGAYNIGSSTTYTGNFFLLPNANAKFRVLEYSEWFKAAYYNGSGNYNAFATQSNNTPTMVFATNIGDGDYRILTLVSNLELDILRSKNLNIVNNYISYLELDTFNTNTLNNLSDRISNFELDIFNSTSNLNIYDRISNLNLDIFVSNTSNTNIVSLYQCDILNSTTNINYNTINSFQIDTLLSQNIKIVEISTLNTECMFSENKKYLLNNILSYDILFNKKT